jgi:ABC-type dipeptide/oligopeptide/nickel transport system ATPase component
MATPIAIVGDSGTGKSTSILPNADLGIKGLDPQRTVIINVAEKPLPTRGWRKMVPDKNIINTSNAAEIVQWIDKIGASDKIDNIVIDDAQYIMAFEFFNRAKESGFNKFTDIAQNISKVIFAVKRIKSNINVFFLWHPEESDGGRKKMKTIGKLTDEKLTLEGLFTTILYTDVANINKSIQYRFVTNHDGVYPAKSPYGMFPELYIKNDLGAVVDYIKKFDDGE